MKRDPELARQLLLDIEARGADCSVSVLRNDTSHDSEERIRYHLRLMIDGGFLREVDRTSAGVPCVRLTHEGHELLELSRHEGRWREAKLICQQRTGGQSITLIKHFLIRLAAGPINSLARPRRTYVSRRPRYDVERYELDDYCTESLRYLERSEEIDYSDSDRVRYVKVRRENDQWVERPVRVGIDCDGDGRIDWEQESTSFPTSLL